MIIGKQVIKFESLGSTNDHLKDLSKHNNVDQGIVVYAKEQTNGRGQHTSKWISEKGKNLTFSFLLLPSFIIAEDQFIISQFVSLAIIDFLKKYTDHCKIKWPNDIYINNQKAGGILIENTITEGLVSKSIIGIGINLNQEKFPPVLPDATSLKINSNGDYDLDQCMLELIGHLNEKYKEISSTVKLKEEYLQALHLLNEQSTFIKNKEIFKATIIDVDKFGYLVLKKENGNKIKAGFKEITFI
jgi:BirA family biotin operon repressor/biotin-[acetyl-CoA-carboxylase] ligase